MIIQPLLFQNIVYNTVFLINIFNMYFVVYVHAMDVWCCVVCVAIMKIFGVSRTNINSVTVFNT